MSGAVHYEADGVWWSGPPVDSPLRREPAGGEPVAQFQAAPGPHMLWSSRGAPGEKVVGGPNSYECCFAHLLNVLRHERDEARARGDDPAAAVLAVLWGHRIARFA
jgi:hypothetical protein